MTELTDEDLANLPVGAKIVVTPNQSWASGAHNAQYIKNGKVHLVRGETCWEHFNPRHKTFWYMGGRIVDWAISARLDRTVVPEYVP